MFDPQMLDTKILDQILPMLSSGTALESLAPIFIAGEVVFGVLSLLLGYRLIKFFIFVAGFLIGMTVAHFLRDSNVFTVLLGGFIGGGLSLALWYLGIFMVGALAGFLLAVALGINIKEVIYVFAFICGVLAIVIRKFMIIVSTSWSGATTLVPLAARLFGCHDEKYLLIPELVLMTFGIWFQYWTAPKKTIAAPAAGTEPAAPVASAGAASSSTPTHT